MTGKIMLAVACGLIALNLNAAGLGSAAANEWPGWRGPNRDGKSLEKGFLKTWPAGGPKLVWKATGIGAGFSSATVAGGAIFTSGIKDGKLHLIRLDMDGKIKWSKPIEDTFVQSHSGSRSSPTFDNGKLYIVTDQGKVGCYDAATGDEQWTKKFSEFGGKMPSWGFAESVLVAGDMAFVTPGGKNCIVALNKKTGEKVWGSDQFANAHYSSPILVKFNNTLMIINGTQGGIIAVEARTGKTLWSNNFSAGNTANCPTPAYEDGYVFWANGYGKGGICLKLEAGPGGAVTATEAWRTRDMDCHHGGYIIKDGFIYGNHGQGWTCLDLKTGEKKWNVPAVAKGSLCYADGMLYLFSEKNGRAGLGPADPSGFSLTGDFTVQGSGPSWAHPVIAGGRLYLRYDDNLYAFDIKGP